MSYTVETCGCCAAREGSCSIATERTSFPLPRNLYCEDAMPQLEKLLRYVRARMGVLERAGSLIPPEGQTVDATGQRV